MSKVFRFIFCIIFSYSCALVAMEQTNQPDPYQVLGLQPNATHQEVRNAYRRLVRENHPDRNGGSQQAEQRIRAINNAYERLNLRCIVDGCNSNYLSIIRLECTDTVCEEHLAEIVDYEPDLNTTLVRNQCPRENCQQQYMTNEEVLDLTHQITQRRIERQRPTIDQTHCAFCDERSYLRLGCGHGLCIRHVYRDFVQQGHRYCAACLNNHIQLPIEFQENFLEQNMERDRIELQYSGICITCPPARRIRLRRNERINLPTCGHCFCMNCAHERFVNQNNNHCSHHDCEASVIGMIDEQATEVQQRVGNYQESVRQFRKVKIAFGVTTVAGVASWLLYEWWQERKAKKAAKAKEKKIREKALQNVQRYYAGI